MNVCVLQRDNPHDGSIAFFSSTSSSATHLSRAADACNACNGFVTIKGESPSPSLPWRLVVKRKHAAR
jgi:hypothetical protein